MKVTLRASRTGSAKHNDRDFDFVNCGDGHIDPARVADNLYMSYKNIRPFQEAERQFYEDQYSDWLIHQNERSIRSRHPERVKTMQDLLVNERTKPDEIILQIGNCREHPDPELFTDCVKDFLKSLEPYQNNYHLIDVAIHKDEETPHAHLRGILDYVDKNGNRQISQEKALEAMGFERPNPEHDSSHKNNRKITFHAELRKKWYDTCEAHGIQVDRAPDIENRTHKSKQAWIIEDLKNEVAQLKSENELLQRRVRDLELERNTHLYDQTR